MIDINRLAKIQKRNRKKIKPALPKLKGREIDELLTQEKIYEILKIETPTEKLNRELNEKLTSI